MSKQGEPIYGIVHSADASSGVAVPFYNQGSHTARTLAPDEYIEIHVAELITLPGGDCYVLIGPDATLGTGETVLRGTFGANGGIKQDHTLATGLPGHTVWVVAPAGVVDVRFTGTVRKEHSTGRPGYRESLVPGA